MFAREVYAPFRGCDVGPVRGVIPFLVNRVGAPLVGLFFPGKLDVVDRFGGRRTDQPPEGPGRSLVAAVGIERAELPRCGTRAETDEDPALNIDVAPTSMVNIPNITAPP